MSAKVVATCDMHGSRPYPNPLGPESQRESSNAIAAHSGGLGGGAGSAVPLKYFHVSPTMIGRGGSAETTVHTPVPALHVCPIGQLTAVPAHVPLAHTSPVVHRLPSVHEAVLFACAQPLAGTHESSVHTFESLQFVAAPETQTPPTQASPVVQALLSLQGFVLFEKTHPLAGLHESVVQRFESLQVSAVPGWHTVATQVSIPLQRLLSVQSASTPHGGLNV